MLYVKQSWCSNVKIISSICSPHIEILSVSLRPFYLPREFSNINMTIIYAPPDAKAEIVKNEVTNILFDTTSKSPDAISLMCGDLNNFDITAANHYQIIDKPTRGDNCLDKFYCNVKNAYTCKTLNEIDGSDHLMIELKPRYERKLKRVKPVIKSITQCRDHDELKYLISTTDWNMFLHTEQNDISRLVDVISGYLLFVFDLLSVKRSVKFYSNNKKWFSKELRALAVDYHKKSQLEEDNYKRAKHEFKLKMRDGKNSYAKKIEGFFHEKQMKKTYAGIKHLLGMDKGRCDSLNVTADELNVFYTRFDNCDHKDEMEKVEKELLSRQKEEDYHFVVNENDVLKTLMKINPRKAAGPDNLSGLLLKTCCRELSPIVTKIFNLSLSSHACPVGWKLGEIIPIPKIQGSNELKNYRPVALTSILAKCLETIIKIEILKLISHKIDPHQFAYQPNMGTEDALITLTLRA